MAQSSGRWPLAKRLFLVFPRKTNRVIYKCSLLKRSLKSPVLFRERPPAAAFLFASCFSLKLYTFKLAIQLISGKDKRRGATVGTMVGILGQMAPLDQGGDFVAGQVIAGLDGRLARH